MKTVRLGATALEISEIGFGGIPIIPLPQEEAVSLSISLKATPPVNSSPWPSRTRSALSA